MHWLPNIITLVRVPVIILLVLPVISSVSVSAEQAFWLYIAGLLSHGLDGALAERILTIRESWGSPKDRGIWHALDAVFLSLGLQIAAAFWLANAGVLPWWVISAYLAVVFVVEFGYIQPRKNTGYVPLVLYGSGIVWLVLGGLLAYQAHETVASVVITTIALIVYGPLIHQNFLHLEVWIDWWDEAHGVDRVMHPR
ncbi:MAG: hypothetical protein WD603_00135 [Patescibacteria group bacterium]